jgi:deoxyribonuclease V
VRFPTLKNWPQEARAARVLQEKLRTRVETQDRLGAVRTVAGIDVGFERDGRVACAAAVVLDFPTLTLREQSVVRTPVRFPYVPGLLSFREIPAMLAALEKLHAMPDLILCDGQGYAHPRRFGLACHLGILLDIPTIGAAKSRLIGEPRGVLAAARGSHVPLMDDGDIIGAVLRTRAGVRPLFVSIGHRLALETAIRYVLACCPRYRLPETTRLAHRLASG